ncbi:MAG: hypothetical protein QW704_00205 [Candidatus Hadarchaeales archaeon]
MLLRDWIASMLGIVGGILVLLSVFAPWYPASGRFTFSCITLLMKRSGGPLMFHIFLLFFGGFILLFGGILARFLSRKDMGNIFFIGSVIGIIGVALTLWYLKGGFTLSNPAPGLYMFFSSPVGWWRLLTDLSYGFYMAIAGVLAGIFGFFLSTSWRERKD